MVNSDWVAGRKNQTTKAKSPSTTTITIPLTQITICFPNTKPCISGTFLWNSVFRILVGFGRRPISKLICGCWLYDRGGIGGGGGIANETCATIIKYIKLWKKKNSKDEDDELLVVSVADVGWCHVTVVMNELIIVRNHRPILP